MNAAVVNGRGCVRISNGASEKRTWVTGRCRKVAQSSIGQVTDEKWVPPIDVKSWVLTYDRIPNLFVLAAHSCFEPLAPLFVYIVSTTNINSF